MGISTEGLVLGSDFRATEKLYDGFSHLQIWSETEIGKYQIRDRRGIVRLKPLFNVLALIGKVVVGKDRIFHDLATNVTAILAGDLKLDTIMLPCSLNLFGSLSMD